MATAIIISGTPAKAAESVRERVPEQRHRIQEGVEHGALTPREAHRLRRGERRIGRLARRDRRSGGRMTGRERARLQRRLNRESGRIYREKHDRQRR